MTYQKITKYYYHYYVLISLFFFSISAASYIFWGDFSPTSTVKIVALIIATSLYALLLLYFLYLEKIKSGLFLVNGNVFMKALDFMLSLFFHYLLSPYSGLT